MFGEEKNLKDSSAGNLGVVIKDTNITISYTKTNKLITALYMVTDIIDKDEPLRNKLRTLGTGIISDIHLLEHSHIGHKESLILEKIAETMSFLGIASDINIISEMNCNILRKEFLELDKSIRESSANTGIENTINKRIDLSEFFKDEQSAPKLFQKIIHGSRMHSIGHVRSTRIGVQKGSTLLKALSDRTQGLSDTNTKSLNQDNFDVLKKQRREDILNTIKTVGGNATIKDIKDKVKQSPEQVHYLVTCSEKTLQRELVSLVRDGVLNKTGEKRWSRYFLK